MSKIVYCLNNGVDQWGEIIPDNFKIASGIRFPTDASVLVRIKPATLKHYNSFLSPAFEEKRRDIVFGFLRCVMRGLWCVVLDF